MNALEAARSSLETADTALEQCYTGPTARLRGGEYYLKARGEITEQLLKLAAIERGINPWAGATGAGDPS